MIFKPNWSESYKITYEYATEVITSRKGREQRIAQRVTARKSFEFKLTLRGLAHRQFHQLMNSQQHLPQAMPQLTKKVFAPAAVAATASTITVSSLPDWVYSGRVVFINDEFNSILSVTPAGGAYVIEFATPVIGAYPQGVTLYYAVLGYLQPSQTVEQATNGAAQVSLKFSVIPGSEDDYIPPAASTIFNGREVFTKRPNWIAPPSIVYSRAVEDLDYGRGLMERFDPVPFGTRVMNLTFLARNMSEADDIVNMHARMLGRQGEFYMDTGLPDISISTNAASGSSTLTVAGTEFEEAFADDTVNRAVCVRLVDGTVIRNVVLSIAQVGFNSVITLQTPWPVTLTVDNVVMISWLPVWRLASDALTVEWLTDSVAQYQISVQTLEDLAV